MVNKFKRGLTSEEAALVAAGLEKYSSLAHAKEDLDDFAEYCAEAEAEANNEYVEYSTYNVTREEIEQLQIDLHNWDLAFDINQALLEEVSIAIEWLDYETGEVDLYSNGLNPKPRNETVLEVLNVMRMAPDDEYAYCPIPKNTTIKKLSLAKWFEQHLPEKAPLFDPSGSYKTVKTGYLQTTKVVKDVHSSSSTIRTPEPSLLDSLAIMAWTLCKKSSRYNRGDRPNAKQIKESVEEAFQDLELSDREDSPIMLSNLNRDISTAIKQLEDKLK